jgi:hypothetical protein
MPPSRDPGGPPCPRGQASTLVCCPSTAEKNMFHHCRGGVRLPCASRRSSQAAPPNSTPVQWQALALGSSQVDGSLRVKQIDKKGTRDADILSYIWVRAHLLSASQPTFGVVLMALQPLSPLASQPHTPVSCSIRSPRRHGR